MTRGLKLSCPGCGREWWLREYAGLRAAKHDRVVHCGECVVPDALERWGGYVHGLAAERVSASRGAA